MERTEDTNGITKDSNWKERFITTSRFREGIERQGSLKKWTRHLMA